MTDGVESRGELSVDERPGDESTGDPDGSTHLDDLEDGAGCTEIWEHLSERREADRDESER